VAPALLVHGATRPTIIQHRECRKALNPSSTRRAGVISKRGWKRKFEDPIPLPRGRQLVTLEDTARYIQKLPKAEQQIEEWQTAVEVLILVAESSDGPTMLARVGVMTALNRHNVRKFNPDRKPHGYPSGQTAGPSHGVASESSDGSAQRAGLVARFIQIAG
jgi:hypothetical protein